MRPNAVRLLVIACAAVVLAGGLVAAAASDKDEVTLGQVYSTDAGDPVDVLAETGDRAGTLCMNVGGFGYGTAVACSASEDLDATGSWELVPATSDGVAPLVLGVLPAGARTAVVRVDGTEVRATTRGRWFLAELEPHALGPQNDAPVAVEFD
jgi:hypothetical protein